MRRLVLVVLTASLISGFTPAWADDSAPPAPSTTVPAAEPTPGPALPDLVGVEPSELLRGTADAAGPVTGQARAEAEDALTTVRQLLDGAPTGPAAPSASSTDGRDATMALRDLSLRMNALSRADRNSALAQFQRPWDDNTAGTRTQCAAIVCVHWVDSSTSPAAPLGLTDDTWALGTVLPVLDSVSRTYVSAGYRQPLTDGPRPGQQPMYGGDGRVDIYLTELNPTNVNNGLAYGYTAYDLNDNGQLTYPQAGGAVPAFMVLDNDFTTTQLNGRVPYHPTYPGETPTDILKVTAAHEYFHATQFAYDAFEDAWFMEATATWAEHQLYPEIPDNRQFLPYSQLRFPQVSLDTWDGVGRTLQYGDWIFFEYLTERLGYRTGPLPDLVLRMWQYADSTRGAAADQYSMQAIASALASRGQSFKTMFAQYAAANRRPAATYQGGAAYPVGTPRRTIIVGARKKRSGTFKIDHLAAMTVRMRPHKVKGHRRATIRVDMADKRLGSVAIATVFLRNGQQRVRTVKLNKKGDGKIGVAFASSKVVYVELTLINANRTYNRCSADRLGFACGGQPAHDHVKEKWSLSS